MALKIDNSPYSRTAPLLPPSLPPSLTAAQPPQAVEEGGIMDTLLGTGKSVLGAVGSAFAMPQRGLLGTIADTVDFAKDPSFGKFGQVIDVMEDTKDPGNDPSALFGLTGTAALLADVFADPIWLIPGGGIAKLAASGSKAGIAGISAFAKAGDKGIAPAVKKAAEAKAKGLPGEASASRNPIATVGEDLTNLKASKDTNVARRERLDAHLKATKKQGTKKQQKEAVRFQAEQKAAARAAEKDAAEIRQRTVPDTEYREKTLKQVRADRAREKALLRKEKKLEKELKAELGSKVAGKTPKQFLDDTAAQEARRKELEGIKREYEPAIAAKKIEDAPPGSIVDDLVNITPEEILAKIEDDIAITAGGVHATKVVAGDITEGAYKAFTDDVLAFSKKYPEKAKGLIAQMNAIERQMAKHPTGKVPIEEAIKAGKLQTKLKKAARAKSVPTVAIKSLGRDLKGIHKRTSDLAEKRVVLKGQSSKLEKKRESIIKAMNDAPPGGKTIDDALGINALKSSVATSKKVIVNNKSSAVKYTKLQKIQKERVKLQERLASNREVLRKATNEELIEATGKTNNLDAQAKFANTIAKAYGDKVGAKISPNQAKNTIKEKERLTKEISAQEEAIENMSKQYDALSSGNKILDGILGKQGSVMSESAIRSAAPEAVSHQVFLRVGIPGVRGAQKKIMIGKKYAPTGKLDRGVDKLIKLSPAMKPALELIKKTRDGLSEAFIPHFKEMREAYDIKLLHQSLGSIHSRGMEASFIAPIHGILNKTPKKKRVAIKTEANELAQRAQGFNIDFVKADFVKGIGYDKKYFQGLKKEDRLEALAVKELYDKASKESKEIFDFFRKGYDNAQELNIAFGISAGHIDNFISQIARGTPEAFKKSTVESIRDKGALVNKPGYAKRRKTTAYQDFDEMLESQQLYFRAQGQAIKSRTMVQDFGNSFARSFKTEKLANEAGYVKPAIDKNLYENWMGKGNYIPEEVNRSFVKLNEMWSAPKSAAQISRFLTKMTRMFKLSAYSINPGHFTVDSIGDTYLLWIEGILTPGPAQLKVLKEGRGALKLYRSDPEKHADASVMIAGEKFLAKDLDETVQIGDLVSSGKSVDKSGALNTSKTVEAHKSEGFKEAAGRVAGEARRRPFKTYVEKIQAGGNLRDTVFREAGFLMALEKSVKAGAKGEIARIEAAMRIRRTLFNYSELTPLEQRWFRNIVPFYTWMRKNIPFQFKASLRAPAKGAIPFKMQRELQEMETSDDGAPAPDYIKDRTFLIPQGITNAIDKIPGIGALVEEDVPFYYNPTLPAFDMGSFQATRAEDDKGINPLGIPLGIDGKEMLGSVNPAIRAPFEVLTHREAFTGNEIGSLPDYALRQIGQPGGVLSSVVDRGLDSEKKALKLTSIALGVRGFSLDPNKAAGIAEMRLEEIEKKRRESLEDNKILPFGILG